MALWKGFLRLLGLGEHVEFICKILDLFGLTNPITWALYVIGAALSGHLASLAEWQPIAVFLAVIGTGAGLSVAYAGLHYVWTLPRLEHPAPAVASRVVHHAKIIFGTGHPFETVAVAGVNRSRTVRVKIQNETDAEMSNGMLQLVGLDPPNKDHNDFLLQNGIGIGPRAHTFVDVAAYNEGSSQGRPGTWINLIVPPAWAFYGPPPNLIPVATHTFHLRFSSWDGEHVKAYCRLSVDETHILRLQEWGDSATIPAAAAEREISLMEAVTRAYEGIKDRSFSIWIEGVASSPDEILILLCGELTKYQDGKEPLVKLRGSKPPSRVKEEIYMAPLSGYEFVVEGQTIVLQENHGQMRYESLSVNTSELDIAIQNLASREV
jgi:hypothetical protein